MAILFSGKVVDAVFADEDFLDLLDGRIGIIILRVIETIHLCSDFLNYPVQLQRVQLSVA